MINIIEAIKNFKSVDKKRKMYDSKNINTYSIPKQDFKYFLKYLNDRNIDYEIIQDSNYIITIKIYFITLYDKLMFEEFGGLYYC